MALQVCKECGGQVSSEADKCPHCGSPIKNPALRQNVGCLPLIGLGFVGLIFLAALDNSGDDTPAAPDEYGAHLICRQFVEKHLKAPATAKFSSDHTVHRAPNTTLEYVVTSEVDSQNSFGAMIRSRYVCHVRSEGGSQWRLISLDIP